MKRNLRTTNWQQTLTLLLIISGCASLLFHSNYSTRGSMAEQWIGFGIISVSLILASALALITARTSFRLAEFIKTNYAALTTIMIVFILGITQITVLPTWPEEIGWLEIGKMIANGQLIHPIRAKSDFPSAFQGWPIGGLISLGASPLVASRLISVFYISCYLLILSKFIQKMTGQSTMPWLVAAMTGVSKSYVVVGLSGWHEVTPIFFLLTIQWYLIFQLWRHPGPSVKIILAIFSGLSVWSLYVPMLMTVCLGLMLIPYLRRITQKENWLALVVFMAIAAPVFGQTFFSNGEIFKRHYDFYIHGGEWPNTKVYSFEDRLQRAYDSFTESLKRYLPAEKSVTIAEWNCPHVEWTLIFLSLLGIVFVLFNFKRQELYALFSPAILLVSGLLLSTPNEYRLTSLLVPTHVFASLGACALISYITFKRGSLVRFLFSVLILIGHYCAVWNTLPEILNFFRTISPHGSLARTAESSLRAMPEYPRIIFGKGGYTIRFINGIMPHDSRLIEFKTIQELSYLIDKYGQAPVAMELTGETDNLDYEITEMLKNMRYKKNLEAQLFGKDNLKILLLQAGRP